MNEREQRPKLKDSAREFLMRVASALGAKILWEMLRH
jgi:hypothetical protein